MSILSTILTPTRVVIDAQADTKKALFEAAATLLGSDLTVSRQHVIDSLFARERLGSTGLGQGIAIPHGRVKGLREAIGAFIRLREPLPFDAPDNRPVNLVFVLLVPERATDAHLQILSELAQMFSDRAFRAELSAAPDALTAQRLIAQWHANVPNT